ncbi:MAG: hypothetical protein MHPSP_003813, partial [Paramarteilia canceri]
QELETYTRHKRIIMASLNDAKRKSEIEKHKRGESSKSERHNKQIPDSISNYSKSKSHADRHRRCFEPYMSR